MKKWYQSKTIWTNVIGFVVGVLVLIQGELEAGMALTGPTLVNILLRVVTNQGITK